MKHVSSKERPSKAALLSTCMRLVRDRIANAEQAIASANAAAADDTKSSAGDKSAGPLAMQGQKCVAVSTASPIGQLMLGKTAGQRFMFNNTEYLIASIA